jgi:FkbM family methyltransferase
VIAASPRLAGNRLDGLVLRTAAVRLLARRHGNCIVPRRGMSALARAVASLPLRRQLCADGLPAVPLDGMGARGLAADWLVRWAWQPYDGLARLIAALVQPGDVTLDVGAFTGWYSYLMAIHAGTAGRVHLVEPQPGLQPLLQRTFAPLGVVACHFIGAGATNTSLPFNCNQSPSMSSFVWTQGQYRTVEVPVRRLDAELGEGTGSGRVTFIKLDVEGFEAAALDGLAGLLDGSPRRPFLHLEMTEPTRAAAAGQPSRVFDRLHALGFELYMVPQLTWRREVPLKWLQAGPEREAPGWVDALAVPAERRAELDRLVEQRDAALVASY